MTKTYKIEQETVTFDDLEGYPEVEVECVVGWTFDRFLRIGEMAGLATSEGTLLEKTVAIAGSSREWGDQVLVSWNLTYDKRDAESGDVVEEDAPIPANGRGLCMLPEGLASAIIARWQEYMTEERPTDDEKKASENGSSASRARTGNRASRRSATSTRS